MKGLLPARGAMVPTNISGSLGTLGRGVKEVFKPILRNLRTSFPRFDGMFHCTYTYSNEDRMQPLSHTLYYALKPLIPRHIQIWLRSAIVRRKRLRFAGVWPIDEKAGQKPEGWQGWPEGRQFALVLTHDVETARGQQYCEKLSTLEEKRGLRSSFNFVPERYRVAEEVRRYLVTHGFEVGVHGLYHDGKYFKSREIFFQRAQRINTYLKSWDAVGYRAPCMQYNLEWFHDLDIMYDASTFDTDPFEPNFHGFNTIFPFRVNGQNGNGRYVELPCTLPQDFTLFILMREIGTDIWERKLDWIASKGGMALIDTHPDYMAFGGQKPSFQQYPVRLYEEFLDYIKTHYEGHYWHALPWQMAKFWTTL